MPQPLSPRMATRSPGWSCSSTPSSSRRDSPGHWKTTCSKLSVSGCGGNASGCAGSSTAGGWSTIWRKRSAATRADCSDCQARPLPAATSSKATVRNSRTAASGALIWSPWNACSPSHSIASRPSPAPAECMTLPPISRRRRRRSCPATCSAAASTRAIHSPCACSAVRSATPSSPSNAKVRSRVRDCARPASPRSPPCTASSGTPMAMRAATTSSTTAAGQ